MDITGLCQGAERDIIAMRRWFHQHPELSFQEKRTEKKICEELEKMQIPYEKLPVNHGVMATIQGAQPGKTLAIRADIDALPVKEDTGLTFASKNEGVMHACGHDAHAAMLLGAAGVLNGMKDTLHGTVKCLFQVAEERGGGYQEALDYFETIGGIDAIIGLHIWSGIPQGEILLIPGAVFAGAFGFSVDVRGKGGHGARPDLTRDPVRAACDLVLKLSAIPSNFYDVLDHSVVVTPVIKTGSTLGNIIPGDVRLEGGVRWYKPGGGEALLEIMQRIGRGVGEAYGVECEVQRTSGVPPVMCHPALVEQARELVPDIEGLALATDSEPVCASDNYGYLVEKYPGFYGILGGGKHDEEVYPQHHQKFDIDEAALRKGTEFMVRFAADFLQ